MCVYIYTYIYIYIWKCKLMNPWPKSSEIQRFSPSVFKKKQTGSICFVVGVMQTFPDGTIAVASATYSFLAGSGFRVFAARSYKAVLLVRLASDVTR